MLVLLEFADMVSVGPGDGGLEVRGPAAADVPADATNLAARGWAAGGGDPAAGLILEKAVPAAAGLGGGSSDAAATWRLARHAGGAPDERPDGETLRDLATIGADVPFFAAQAAAGLVGGIGEIVEPLPARPDATEVVLVHPPFGLSTAAVFGELRPSDWSSDPDGPPERPGRNDLLAPALRLRPELDDVLRVVAGAGGEPHLTGSGPTVFVLTDDPERADGVVPRVERAGLTATRTRLRDEPASIEPW
jgi:4-diphosphocytidyl-2-C-methyl-D-erythritol kinase